MPARWQGPGRDRLLLLAGLAGVTAAGWLVLARMHAGMPTTDAAAMPGMPMAPGASYGMTLAMWVAMMTAMMAPATGPSASAYLALARRRHPGPGALPATAGFFVGYMAAWLGYAALAAGAQSALARAMLLTPMGTLASAYVAAAVLVAAGAYQLTPLKRTCVTRCRNPLLQLMAGWRDGAGGALRLGLRQGSWCVACCWGLMALMFVVGVMSLAWMAILTAFVLAERLVPARWHLDLVSGLLLVGSGAWMALMAVG